MQTREFFFVVFKIYGHEYNDFFSRKTRALFGIDEDLEIARYQVKCLNFAL